MEIQGQGIISRQKALFFLPEVSVEGPRLEHKLQHRIQSLVEKALSFPNELIALESAKCAIVEQRVLLIMSCRRKPPGYCKGEQIIRVLAL